MECTSKKSATAYAQGVQWWVPHAFSADFNFVWIESRYLWILCWWYQTLRAIVYANPLVSSRTFKIVFQLVKNGISSRSRKAKVICLSASMTGSSFLPQFHFMVALERLLKMDLPISFRITCRVLRSTEHWDSIGSSHGICREWRTEYAFHQIHSLHEERLSFCLLVDFKDKCTKQDKLSTSDSKQNPFCSSFDYPKWPPIYIWINRVGK